MRKLSLFAVMMALLMGIAIPHTAQAHPYLYYGPTNGNGDPMSPEPYATLQDVAADFVNIMGRLCTNETGATAGCNLWLKTGTNCGAYAPAPIWQQVVGQQAATWDAANSGMGSTAAWATQYSPVPTNKHFALLDEVLNPAACLDGLPGSTVQGIRDAFNYNKTFTLDQELTMYSVNLTASALGGGANSTQTITTGGMTSAIDFKLAGITVYTIDPQQVPNLFKTDDSLLRSADDYLRDAIVNMTAAYMTMGMDTYQYYWQAFTGRMALVFLQDRLKDLITGLLKSDDNGMPVFEVETIEEGMQLALAYAFSKIEVDPTGADDKAAVACAPWGTVNDVDTGDFTISVKGDEKIDVTARVRMTGFDACNSVRNFSQKFVLGPGKYDSRPQFLSVKDASQGDLNNNGEKNLTSYNAVGGDKDQWLIRESARLNMFYTTQPTAPAAPLNYGTSRTLSCVISCPTPHTFLWYSGPSPASLTAIPGSVGPNLPIFLDFYSFGGTTNSRYYKCVVTTSCSGNSFELSSDTVEVTGVNPPPITFNAQPVGGSFVPGQSATLSVNATVSVGGPLTYQWQKETSPGVWTDLAGKTLSSLTLNPIKGTDAGNYRCVVFNIVATGKADKANPLYFEASNPATLNVAPDIEITQNPAGADLGIGDSHSMSIAATVASGTLSYQWQRNIGFGWQAIGGATGTTYDLINVTVNNAGSYRCRVTNTEPTYGTYSVFTAAAVVNVSSGLVVYVDPTAPGSQDGSSWDNAFHTLQEGIDAANAGASGGEVWVAGGTAGTPLVYGEARTEAWGNTSVPGSLVMKSNVAMYGGFEGYRSGGGAQEDQRRERARLQNPTIISGATSNAGGAAFHVVVFGRNAGPTVNATLDGFGITGGNAAGVSGDYHTWRGGGVYNWQSSPTIANCMIYANTAAVSGGGIANESNGGNKANAQIINCVIFGNSAGRAADDYLAGNPVPIRGGGGVFNNYANPVMTWVTVANNTIGNPAYTMFGATSGGVYNWEASPSINSSIIWANPEGGIQTDLTAGSLENPTVVYSDVQAPMPAGTGNISSDPLLNPDYTLPVGSPAVDTADPALQGDDLRGVPRPLNGGAAPVADMGAFELSLNGPVPACLPFTINIAAINTITDPLLVYDGDLSVIEAGLWKLALESKTFDCDDIVSGSTIQLTATDILGRTGTCNAVVTVIEDEDPVAAGGVTLPVVLDGSGSYTLTAGDVQTLAGVASDNCGINWAACSASPASVNCTQANTTVPVTITVVDNSGNSTTATSSVTVADETDPTVVCAAIDVNLNPAGTYTLQFADIQALGAGSSDNCGINWNSAVVSQTTFGCADRLAPVTVTLTVADDSGNTGTCNTAQVTVHDVTPGTLSNIVAQNFVKDQGAYSEAAALAGVTADDLCDGDISGNITVEAFDATMAPVAFPVPDTSPDSTYPYVFTLRYSVSDNSGNATSPVDTTLTLVDNLLPVITITGDNPATVICPAGYTDLGATALDDESGDLTALIQTTGLPVNTGVHGSYNVVYTVIDPVTSATVTATRVVNVVDDAAPTVTLLGANPYGVQINTTYTDPGYTASDSCRGDLTSSVVVTGSVDMATAGTYTLTYTVSDGVNAPVSVTRDVIVGNLVNFTTNPVGGALYSNAPASAPLDLTAVFADGINVSTYQWFYTLNGGAAVAIGTPTAVTGNTLTLSVDPTVYANGAYTFYVSVNDDTGATSSAAASVEIDSHLAVGTGLTDISLLEGANYDWAFAASGGLGAITYQWAKDDGSKAFVALSDGAGLSGTGTSTLTITGFLPDMAGTYQVTAEDDGGDSVSSSASITYDVGVPLAGGLGLAALALITALGGASALRKRDK